MWTLLAKPGPSLYERIRRALRAVPRGVHGRADLTRDVFGETFSLEDVKAFNECLNDLIKWGQAIEAKRQLPGTGNEGPPVFEFVYTIGRAPTVLI